MKNLNLTGCTSFTAKGIISLIESCQNIQALELGNTNVDDSVLGTILLFEMSQLISFFKTEKLVELDRDLNTLYVENTQVTDVGFVAYCDSAMNLHYISLEETKITDASIQALSERKSNKPPKILWKFLVSDVYYLYLSKCPGLTDACLPTIFETDVSVLDISYNNFSSEALDKVFSNDETEHSDLYNLIIDGLDVSEDSVNKILEGKRLPFYKLNTYTTYELI